MYKRILLIILSLVFMTACGSGKFEEQPEAKNTLIKGKETYKYTVRGKEYKVDKTITSYKKEGVASWYGPGFHGKKTANGEIYNQNAMTAAHKTLPLGSVVDVTRLDSNKTIRVRINDRGPFINNRIIDLSKKAASQLDMMKSGISEVEVKLVSTPYFNVKNVKKVKKDSSSTSLGKIKTATSDVTETATAKTATNTAGKIPNLFADS